MLCCAVRSPFCAAALLTTVLHSAVLPTPTLYSVADSHVARCCWPICHIVSVADPSLYCDDDRLLCIIWLLLYSAADPYVMRCCWPLCHTVSVSDPNVISRCWQTPTQYSIPIVHRRQLLRYTVLLTPMLCHFGDRPLSHTALLTDSYTVTPVVRRCRFLRYTMLLIPMSYRFSDWPLRHTALLTDSNCTSLLTPTLCDAADPYTLQFRWLTPTSHRDADRTLKSIWVVHRCWLFYCTVSHPYNYCPALFLPVIHAPLTPVDHRCLTLCCTVLLTPT